LSLKCVVGLGTFLRPDGLKLVIESLSKAFDKVNFSVAIVVCDNDPYRSAESYVSIFSKEVRYQIFYINESRPGIAFVRNSIVKKFLELGAEYLCFIDDDETVDSLWLKSIVEYANNSQSDIIQGKVISVFDEEVTFLFQSLRVFRKKNILTGSVLDRAVTNNILVKREVFLKIGAFDSIRGAMGGTDSDFTCRAVYLGFVIRYCSEAIVFDCIPLSRCTLKWVFKRMFSIGGMVAEARRYPGGFVKTIKPSLLIFKHFFEGFFFLTRGFLFIFSVKGRVFFVEGIGSMLMATALFLGHFNIFYALYGRDKNGKIDQKIVWKPEVSKKYIFKDNQCNQVW
jgi:succinoglycan biosynthesis protein ExoM